MLFVPSDAEMPIFISEIGRNPFGIAHIYEELGPCKKEDNAAFSTDWSNTGKDCSYNCDHLLIDFIYHLLWISTKLHLTSFIRP